MEPIVINKSVKHGEEETIINELFDNYKDFDGIFVSGCILADALYKKVRNLGINVPKDLQIISYDGEFGLNHQKHLTTLEQPLNVMAERCVDLPIKLIDEDKDIEKINKFDCHFIKGETTK